MSHDRDAFERRFLRSLDRDVRPPLRLDGDGYGAAEGWFLGPKGENEELLIELIVDAIREHCRYRRNFHPEDPEGISDEEKASEAYKYAVKTLRGYAGQLLEKLQLSAPFFSMRYQSHMLWDQVLPAMVGYFSAMLYNQNNVAAEASPITTLLEIEVGNDLCRMLGYGAADGIVPWGHITCGGTVANIEALWAARNAKFFPVAVKRALEDRGDLLPAWDLRVAAGKLRELSTWELLNLELDETLALPYRIAQLCVLPAGNGRRKPETPEEALKRLNRAINKYTVQNIGMVEFYQHETMKGIALPVVFVPSTQHYSWPKGATLLGLGQDSVKKIFVDDQARMQVARLDQELTQCRDRQIPVLAVVAVMGSTAESAVDPLTDILQVREDFRKGGSRLDFVLHCDAAWGGYFASMLHADQPSGRVDRPAQPDPENEAAVLQVLEDLKTNKDIVRAFKQDDSAATAVQRSHWFSEALAHFRRYFSLFPMNPYVAAQYAALGKADSITVDPHKAGYAPYPAGALCYRNSRMRDLISLKAPVIFHSESEPTVGIYGIEGSKPGAAAAGVWLAHRVIRPTQGGYGRILGQCMWTCTRLYCRLVTMARPEDPFEIVVMHKLPTERDPAGDIQEEMTKLRKEYVPKNNWELLAYLKDHPKEAQRFMRLGSDQLILSYSFNFYDPDPQDPAKRGRLNTDLARMNALNDRIFEICSVTAPIPDLSSKKLILTASSFGADSYGPDFVKEYCGRAQVTYRQGMDVSFLISTTMDPWTTDVDRTPDTPEGDFLAVVEDALRGAVLQARQELLEKEKAAAAAGGQPGPNPQGDRRIAHTRNRKEHP